MRLSIVWTVVLMLCTMQGSAQDSSRLQQLNSLTSSYYQQVSDKLQSQESRMEKELSRSLEKVGKAEKKLFKKLFKKDSLQAKALFAGISSNKDGIADQARSRVEKIDQYAKTYTGKLDSIGTAISFLQKGSLLKPDVSKEAAKTLQSIGNLQGQLDQANQVSKLLQERKELLQSRLKELGMMKELKRYNKEVVYYQQQFKEYKEILNDPSKLEGKLLDIATSIPAFRNFFNQHSALAGLFRLPSDGGLEGGSSLAGFQTRESITQDMQSRFGNNANVSQVMQQNIRQARQQFNERQERQNNGDAGNPSDDLPHFKPNSQRTKTFWNRIELGTDFQSQRSNQFFPVTSDVAVSAGYKMNDKSIIGVGASYKIGWGENIQHIKVSSQGAGLRSFLDWKIKGSFFASGGFEMNYRSAFDQIQQLRDYSAWQQSGLLGLSKTISLRSKFFQKTKLQLMWDFLSYQQVPRTQAILFRVGYNFKSFQ